VRLLLLICLLAGGSAWAQAWPAKPITLVAPSTPGSAPDVLARVMAQKLSESLRQQMVVVNRPGAGTNIGTVGVAQAAPDGYTVLLGSIANTLNPHIMVNVGYRVPGFAFRAAMSSATVLGGKDGCTTSTSGAAATLDTGAKSSSTR
jgi:tripartite-type tricarboxylate transporter receptor subunit TctC